MKKLSAPSAKRGGEKIRQLYIGDNLPIMRGMNDDTVDLIYLDPPFNTGEDWTNPLKDTDKKIISQFKDTWSLADVHADEHNLINDEHEELADIITALGKINGESWKAYLIYMAARLLEMRRILKPTGSIYLHVDPTMSHGLKIIMDAIFGEKNFRNEILWHYAKIGVAKLKWTANTDHLLFYTNSDNYHFAYQVLDRPNEIYTRFEKLVVDNQLRFGELKTRNDSITKSKIRVAEKRLGRALTDSDVVIDFNDPRNKKRMDNVWKIPSLKGNSEEYQGHTTQKPLALLERIIKASSRENDVVFDPFCGCATACVAAEILGRQWIGCDLSSVVSVLMERRISKEYKQQHIFIKFEQVNIVDKPPQRKLTSKQKQTPDNILRPMLYKKQGGICIGCKNPYLLKDMHTDHKQAKAQGGLDIDTNKQLLCGSCNSIKGHRGMRYLRRRLLEIKHEEELERMNMWNNGTNGNGNTDG